MQRHLCVVNSISDWLNGAKDYHTGVALYRCYGDSKLLQMFNQGESPLRKERLVKELQQLRNAAAAPFLPDAAPVPKTIVIAGNKAAMPETKVKEQDDPYVSDWKPLYKEMNHLRSLLEVAENDQVRGEMTFRLLDLEQQCMYWWAKADFFKKYGTHMQEDKPETEVIVDKNGFHRLLTNLRTRISKIRGKLKQSPDDPELLLKLIELEQERDRIEKLL